MASHSFQSEPSITVRRDRQSAGTAASSAQAAAIVAALERFMRDTASAPPTPLLGPEPWTRVAMLEAVGHEDEWPSAWGDPLSWS
jgi:hypothetical protein